MRLGWRVPAGWGALLLAWTAVQLAFTPTAVELALLGGAGLVCVTLGLLARRSERDLPAEQAVPDTSAPTALLAVGLVLCVLGTELGPWAVYVGGGTMVIALASLLRERREEGRR